ncbi:putative serine/threonine-protein kinase-like protein ccr3 [Quercus suber]|uniref:non-specific serine/threonine protein kinase n=1 Tax=Quercus suber TaxID=58331 RepID=A0AAW0M761_QUESU
MTISPFSLAITVTLTTLISFLLQTVVYSLGSASTTTITYGTATVCGIIAAEPTQRIQCYQNGQIISIQPNISFEAVSGGRSFFCGLRSGGSSLICWDTSSSNSSFNPKRIYHNETIKMTDLAVGDAQVCAREVNSGMINCWRGNNGSKFPSPGEALRFRAITSGSGFSCGILKNNCTVLCWGNGNIGAEIQRQFGNVTMSTLVAGKSHACGLTMTGILVCKGNNGSGQLDVPFSSAYEFSGLALGENFTCAIKVRNGLVTCWGGKNRFEFDSNVIENVSFESIVAGLDFACGLTSSNLSMICWGPGWSNMPSELPLGRSGSSTSYKHADKTQIFSFAELSTATDNFSLENKIGAGSFGIVYKGKLADGREVAIKRGETSIKTKKFQEKESAFDAELALLSRLNHKHLVGLIGFCEEKDERLLVYEYMSNGSLHDHLHNKLNINRSSSIWNSWNMRIKIALDAARGIEYLHNYAVPPIIHRDIKSSNILLDANWTARLQKVLDKRVGLPEVTEAEAVRLVAYTAMHCVHLEGKERPNISDIVGNLERALALCEDNPGSLSPATLSTHSE